MASYLDEPCKHCGGSKKIRNPTGKCDHLCWPEFLTEEAMIANGYVKVTRIVEEREWKKQDE